MRGDTSSVVIALVFSDYIQYFRLLRRLTVKGKREAFSISVSHMQSIKVNQRGRRKKKPKNPAILPGSSFFRQLYVTAPSSKELQYYPGPPLSETVTICIYLYLR